MTLFDYFYKEIQLSTDNAEALSNLFDFRKLPKGHELLREGSQSKRIFFVEKGLIRMHYNKDGKDITHFFFTEGMTYIPIENVFLNQPYPYRIELLEDSIIRSVDFSQFEEYLDSDLKLQRFARYLMIVTIKRLASHLFSIQFQSAQDRYKILLENYPTILLRAPLGHIASYLGITQQTLSVIRSTKT